MKVDSTAMIRRFQRLAGRLEKEHAVVIQLALLRGRRWSYLAGRMPDPGRAPVSERLKLGPGLGLVIYGLEELGPAERLRALETIGASFSAGADRPLDQ